MTKKNKKLIDSITYDPFNRRFYIDKFNIYMWAYTKEKLIEDIKKRG